jgi:cathepsin F
MMASTFFVTSYLCLIVMCHAQLGGWSDADMNSEEIKKMAQFAFEHLDGKSNSLYASRLESIISARTQVVAGVKYDITLRLATLDCKRSEAQDVQSCSAVSYQQCSVQIYEQSWTDTLEVESFACQNEPEAPVMMSRKKRSLMGGSTDIESFEDNSPERLAVDFVVDHLSAESNGFYGVEFNRFVKGTKQLVAGLLFRLTVELNMKSCARNDESETKRLSECPAEHQTDLLECDVEIHYQAWLEPAYDLKSYHCHPSVSSANTLYFQKHNQLIGGQHDVSLKDSFESFKTKFGKTYSTQEEEQERYAIFQSNMNLARQIQEYDRGTATYGASQFADLTPEEFQERYLSRQWDTSHDSRLAKAEIPDETAPDSFDWRDHGAVTAVKNQGSCGSCWAFSVTGNVEGQWAVQKKKLAPLSEQELVDCDKLDEGCNGGLPSNAYQEIQRLGGLETESDYPYKGEDEKCAFVKQEAKFYINGSLNISKNEDDMKAWIYKNGPASIGINAFAMQFYLGGISHPWKIFCAPDFLDHGVLIVGYGVHKGWFSTTPYWIIKNSWGPSWGEKGYYLVYRGDGVCGLNTMVSSSIVN